MEKKGKRIFQMGGGVTPPQPDPRQPINWADFKSPGFFNNPTLYTIAPQDLVGIIRSNENLRRDTQYFIENYNRNLPLYNPTSPTLFRTNSFSPDRQTYLTGYTGMDFTKLAANNVVSREYGGRIFETGGTMSKQGTYINNGEQVKPTMGQVVSGAVLTGVGDNAEANAELENGEVVRFPDGSIAEVLGATHDKGGVNLILPDMTEVLSNTKDLTLTRADVKLLEKEYGLKHLSTKDTYSKAIDKFARKIGYRKNLEEEMEIVEQIAKTTKNAMSEGSLSVNNAYLTEKYRKNQTEKQPLQKQLSDFYTKVFDRQQTQKVEKGMETEETLAQQQDAPYNAEMAADQGLGQGEIFKLGGTYNEVKNIAQKYGRTERQVYDMLNKKGLIPKMPDGGIYRVTTNTNTYSGQERPQLQKAGEQAYGSISSAESALTQLYQNFPEVFSKGLREGDYGKYITVQDGSIKLKSGVKLNTVNNELIGTLQKGIDNQMRSTAQYILNDKTNRFNEDDKVKAQTYLENETFNNEADARAFDSKLGQFTSGRYSLRTNLVTPEEQKLLNDAGVFTYRQLENSEVELSEATKNRIKTFSEGLPSDADFGIDTYTDPAQPVSTIPEVPNNEGQAIVDNISGQPQGPRGNRFFQMPDQSYLPPMALQAEGLYTNQFGRIDPIRVGIEGTLKRNADQMQFTAAQLQNLPPSQAAAIMAGVIAQNQQSENQVITQANQYNAQAEAQAEMFNIGQADREEVSNNAAKLNYEQRALLGLSKTDQDVRNFYNANREIQLNNYKEQQVMNTISNLFPEYNVDFTGTDTYYDSRTGTTFRRPAPLWNAAVSAQQRTIAPVTTKKATT